jgi:DNA-binding response OmpR family regulator
MVSGLSILVVDDETGLADLYAVWLSDNHNVETAYSGEEALAKVDAAIDIVFLDRRMPQMSGDEVLATIRDQNLDCQVAMVTGVDADFDILEMPFDDYLSKPISEEDLTAVVDRLHRRSAYDDAIQDYFSLVSRQATLEAEKQPEQLAGNEEYAKLVDKIEARRADLDSLTDQLDEADVDAFFAEF